MRARIIPPSPLVENKLNDRKVMLWVTCCVLHEVFGFGAKRLALFVNQFTDLLGQYNNIKAKEGQWSADAQLIKLVRECFGNQVDINTFWRA